MSFSVCSLFSGIGGIDIGFKQAGFDIVWANEIDSATSITYCHNLDKNVLIKEDICKIQIESIPDFDILVAGFPCQPFSIAGKQKGFNDPRGNLFFQISRIVEKKRPKVVFLENVANLLEHNNGNTFLTIYNALAPYGYTIKYKIMDSAEFGNIPQHRKRIFIVAFLDNDKCEKFKFPEKIDLTTKLNDILIRNIKHNSCYYYTRNSCYFEELKKKVTDKYAIYKINDFGVSRKAYYICPTLTANMGTFPNRVPVIIDDFGIRKITPYECLALQGFPQNYKFSNISLSDAYKQCGNSVVVPVIKRIAEQISSALS